jgi:hypothetical protein
MICKHSNSEGNQPLRQRRETHLIYHIDKGLGIVPREVPNDFDLIAVREDLRDQRDAFVSGEAVTDQPFPSWVLAVNKHKKAFGIRRCIILGMHKGLTDCE